MKPIVLAHWSKLIENFQFSPTDFYTRIEAAIKNREVPGLENTRVEWKEGGALSPNRIYLRLSRERMFFDLCGAPFGKGFFVSSRFCETPLVITGAQILFVLISFAFSWYVFERNFGLILGSIYFLVAFLLVIWLLRNLTSLGLTDFDAMLLKIPLIGPIYELFFRPMTYYRIDLMLMYQESVHNAVLEVVDEITKDKAVKPLTELERRPVYADLMKR